MTTASIKPGWSARAVALLGDGDALETVTALERRLYDEWYAVDAAVLAALRSGTSIRELNRLSERSVTYIRRLRDIPARTEPVPGDVRALALAWYETYSDMMMLAAHAHLNLGVKQVEIARATGYSASAVATWMRAARSIAP